MLGQFQINSLFTGVSKTHQWKRIVQ